MKLVLIFLAIIFLVTLSNCSNNYSLQNESFDENLLLKQNILEKGLDSKYGISKEAYTEFVDNIIFDEKGNIIGAIYDKIENQLDDNASNEFWSNFGFKVRNVKNNSTNISARNETLDDGPVIFEGYKPRRGGCKANNRWICVIRDY